MQQRVRFDNRQGHSLAGILHLPDTQETKAFALFAHCFTCTKNINSATSIADALAQQGIATLRFDFTGLGASKGDFSESTFTTDVHDLIDAANFLANEFEPPQLLIGHSLGGTAILAASFQIDSAKAVASIGSPASPSHILHLIESELDDIENSGSSEVELVGRKFVFKKSFVDDARSYTIDYRKLGKALMVMHSPIDDTVSIDEAGKIFTAAMHPKSFVSLDNADHLLTRGVDSRYVGEVLAGWSQRYIDPSSKQNQHAVEGVVVSAKTDQGFLCKINAGGHQQFADEPSSVGGTNLGPTPYDYLSSALGTCTAMTLNMYARHKKLDLTNVTVAVEHERIHADDCRDCETQDGKIDVLKRRILIEGDLSTEQRDRLLEIADRCPVHRTLENEIKVRSQLDLNEV